MTSPTERNVIDRVTPILPLASVIVGGFLVIAVIATGWMAQNAADNSSQVRRGNEIAACRSDLYGTVAQTAQALDQARADLDVLVATGLEAALQNDQERVDAVLSEIDAVTENVSTRAAAARSAANAYVDGTSLAATDADAFLDQCRNPTEEP